MLGDKNSEIFSYHFGVEPNGNVDPKKDIQGELKNKVCDFFLRNFSCIQTI